MHVSSDLTRLSNVKITYFFDFNPCKYVFHLKQNSRKTLENDTKVLFTFQKKSQLMINNEYVIGIKFLNKSKSNQVR